MNRREAVKGVALIAAGVALANVTVQAKPEKLYPWVREARDRRRASTPPRFTCVHYCDQCKGEYLCPDRWDFDECGPSKEAKRLWGSDGRNHRCSACLANYDEANRAAYKEAHRVKS